MQSQFVYHLIPKQVQGEILYPLNRLRKIAPILAATYAKKYVGREAILERRIPPLNCLWNDVLMFCPVHPRDIVQTFQEEGYTVKPRRWFEVPLSRFELENTAVYFPKNRSFGSFTRVEDQFTLLSGVDFEPLTKQTDELCDHIQQARSENRKPFMFMGLPHILYKGSLPLDGIEIVEY